MLDTIERGDTDLPGGVITFLFSDIEGSTELFRELGDDYPPLLLRHNELLRSVWSANNGVEVRTEGDAFFVAFVDAADAIRAGVDAVEALAAYPWPPNAALRARIGMHTGLGFPRDGDYIAYPVHQAARIASSGHGGQVIVSPETADQASNLGDVRLHNLGRFRVRDFVQPIDLFQAERNEAPTTFRDLRTETGRRHNLATPLPAMWGRSDDLTGLADQVSQSRVVSLVGPGGVGKTLLASTLASDLATTYADGCWFVDLASHTDASTLRGAVADALSIKSTDLDDHLGKSNLLLVLDNAEQAIQAVAHLVVQLIKHGPGVSVLVTSREPLSIASERVWRLGLIDEDAAIELFLERSAAVAPDGAAPPQRSDVGELCRRVEGLPLAVELAAARTSSLSVPEILGSLDDQLRLLQSRRRDLDERQRTVFGLIDWSYRLLEEEQQAVFRRLGSFSGSLDLNGVVSICGDLDLDEFDVMDIMWSLADKSLVLPVIGDGTTRYRLLATVRSFARETLATAGELEPVLRNLGQWFRPRLDPQLPWSPEQRSQASSEVETLRALALDLAVVDPSLAQRLAWALGAFHSLRDPVRGHTELAQLVELLAVEGEAVLGLLAIAANVSAKIGSLDEASTLISEANVLRERMPPDAVGAVMIDNAAALVEMLSGNMEGARSFASKALLEANGLERLPAAQILGGIQIETGDYEAAEASYSDVRSTAGALGAIDIEAVAVGALAEVAHRAGDAERARTLTGEALVLAQEAGLRAQVGFSIVGVARLIADEGQSADAICLHAAADRILAETGLGLFGADQEISAAMKASAKQTVGSVEFDRLEVAGRALSDLDAFGQSFEALHGAPVVDSAE